MKNIFSNFITIVLLVFYSLSSFSQTGIIQTERLSPVGIVSFTQNSKLSDISDSKHVDGYVKKTGTSLFVFPVGHRGSYRPFAALADGIVGAYFQDNPGSAALPAGGPFNVANKEAGIKNVSQKEYWDINGINASRISLTWNQASGIGTLTENSLQFLSILGWSTTNKRWEKITSVLDEVALTGGASSLTSGSITTVLSIVPDLYSVYTLGVIETAVEPSNYEGSLETVSCTEISGWVWDKNYPESKLIVEVLEGGAVIATTTANIYREDVKNAGNGTGNYGFKVATPAILMDGKAHQVSARVKGSSASISGSPKSVNCGYNGVFESADCYNISGWVWDKNNPGSTLTVEILDGNTVVVTTNANIFRQSLKDLGYGSGNYGFSLPVPPSLRDGKNHQISVRLKGIDYKLEGSGKTLTCSTSEYFGRFEYASCSTVSGWVWDKSYPNTPLTIELVEGNTVVATGVADQLKQTLADQGYGSGKYGFSILFPASLKNGQSHQLSVRAKGTSYVLVDSPKSITCAANEYVGSINSADCNMVRGFVMDKLQLNTSLTVELLEGANVISVSQANIFQQSLKDAGYGSGNFGFAIPVPVAMKDGQAHQLSVRVKNTSFIVANSPKTITCAANDYNGRFEMANCSLVSGWVWDKNNPATALTVELVEGTTVVGTGLANVFKQTLKDQGYGTGNYGFSFSLPASLKDGKAHQLSVRVNGSSYILSDSPRSVTCATNEYLGSINSADCNMVRGFVFDKLNYNTSLTVELVEGTTVVASGLANIFQQSLKDAGYGTGNYGFAISVPTSVKDGQAHQLTARVKGTSFVLANSPKTISCAANEYAGRFESASCNVVSGWAWDKNNPNTPLTVEVVEGGVVKASGVANVFKQTLKDQGYGTGNYGFSIALPSSLKDGQPHQISVRISGTSYTLTDSPRSVSCVGNDYAGRLNSADCSTVKGWAWDKVNPNTALIVELMDGSTVIASGLANIFQQTLADAGYGTGNYGFTIALPSSVKDGQAHQLSVRIKNTSYVLSDSPKSVTCAVNEYGGRFEYASCNVLTGWAWDKRNPNTPLTVELLEGGNVKGSAVANIFKQSLKDQGYGTGNYGFSIALPSSLKDGQPHQLSVRINGTSYVLSDSPKSVSCAGNDYTGRLNSVDCSTVKGWVWDKINPNAALTVELVEGSTVLATAVANTFQQTLLDAGYGTGNYGFAIPLPSSVRDGQAHQLSVRVKNTSYVLTDSPKSVTCAVNEYAGRFEYASCNVVMGWAWDKKNPGTPLTVDLIEGGTVKASGVANVFKQSLKDQGYGTGNYGFSIPVPSSLKDGQVHQLSVRINGSSFILSDSPRSLSCAATARVGSENLIEVENSSQILDEHLDNWELIAAPNPTKGRVGVSIYVSAGKFATLTLTNLLGQAVWQTTFEGLGESQQKEIDLTNLTDGVYLLKAQIDHSVKVRRIVLTK